MAEVPTSPPGSGGESLSDPQQDAAFKEAVRQTFAPVEQKVKEMGLGQNPDPATAAGLRNELPQLPEQVMDANALAQRTQDAFTARQAIEGGGPSVIGQDTPKEALFDKPTSNARSLEGSGRSAGETFWRSFEEWFKPASPEEQEAFSQALETYMESISGGKPSPEAVQSIMEALERTRAEDAARREGEKEGVVKGAVGAMLEILNRSEFRGLFPSGDGNNLQKPDKTKMWDWLTSKMSPSEATNSQVSPTPPASPAGGNPGK